ncbi:MAG TPA: hypothetical protein VI916_09615 [Acidimicrobiia bacterium]|nr:hypothetical protein [Acidimicrobiia bacterium]
MTDQRRVDRVLEPDFLDNLPARAEDELRSMRKDCQEVETEYSYLRRLAQARIAILEAERARRERGAPLSELIDELPKILADGEPPRPGQADVRIPALLAPKKLSGYHRGLERLVEDDTLANLPNLSDGEVAESIEQLHALEREVSEIRKSLHDVIDTLAEQLAARSTASA